MNKKFQKFLLNRKNKKEKKFQKWNKQLNKNYINLEKKKEFNKSQLQKIKQMIPNYNFSSVDNKYFFSFNNEIVGISINEDNNIKNNTKAFNQPLINNKGYNTSIVNKKHKYNVRFNNRTGCSFVCKNKKKNPDPDPDPNYILKNVIIDGILRTYFVSNIQSNKILIVFHGTGGGGVDRKLDVLIPEFQIIQPIGLKNLDGRNSWNSVPGSPCNSQANDIEFVKTLLDTYTDSNSKAYCGGFSVGSGFTARLSVESISSRFDGFIMFSSGNQQSDLDKITNTNCNIFMSNGDLDRISPIQGGTGIAKYEGEPCYLFSSFVNNINKWSNVIFGDDTTESTDGANNKIYHNSNSNYNVNGIIFKDTGHASVSDSITFWLNNLNGITEEDNLFTAAVRIVSGDIIYNP